MSDTAKKYKSKKFRVAVEGATTDGRVIAREWIEQMAKNYSPKKYGARINVEHIKGFHPESDFRAFGDVISLSTEAFQDGDKEKLALVAEISPTEELVAFTKKRQKVYTSIEVHPKFADTGEAYLTGLAVTDTPASLGTEMLEFSSKAAHNPLAGRKTAPECLFTAAEEVQLSFEEEGESLTDKIKALFTKTENKATETVDKFKQDAEGALNVLAEELSTFKAEAQTQWAVVQELSLANKALSEELTSLKEALGKEQQTFTPAPATGANNQTAVTDC